MRPAIPVTTLFLDSGGVLLSGEWGHHCRERAATKFKQIRFVGSIIFSASSACAKPAWFGLRDDEGLIHETC